MEKRFTLSAVFAAFLLPALVGVLAVSSAVREKDRAMAAMRSEMDSVVRLDSTDFATLVEIYKHDYRVNRKRVLALCEYWAHTQDGRSHKAWEGCKECDAAFQVVQSVIEENEK